MQDALLRASRRWQTIGQLDRPEAYVRKMIVNEFLSWRRRSWRLVPGGTGGGLDGPPIPDPAADYAERDAITTELAKLPRRQRTVLVLRYYQGLSDPEIAEVRAPGPGTVRGYAARALAALRAEMAGPPRRAPRDHGGADMTTGTNGRSEDDLRAALATLERHAPDAGTVLRAVRERTERHTGRPGR